MLSNENHTNITLKLVDGEIKTHSIYLRKLTFFENLLQDPHKIFYLNFNKKPMERILEVIYTDEIEFFDEGCANDIQNIIDIYEISVYLNFYSISNYIINNLNIHTLDQLIIILKYDKYKNIKNIINEYFRNELLNVETITKIISVNTNIKYKECTLIIKDESYDILNKIFIDLHNIFEKINIYYICVDVIGLFSKINLFNNNKHFIKNYSQLVKIILNININKHLIDETVYDKINDKNFIETINIIFKIKELKTKYFIFKSHKTKFLKNYTNSELYRSIDDLYYNFIDKINNIIVYDDNYIEKILTDIDGVDKEIYFVFDAETKLESINILNIYKTICERKILLPKHNIHESSCMKKNIEFLNEKKYTNITIHLLNDHIECHKEFLIKLEYFNNLLKYTNKIYFYDYDRYSVLKIIECIYDNDVKKILENIILEKLLKIFDFANYICYDKVHNFIKNTITIKNIKDLILIIKYNEIYGVFVSKINEYLTLNGFTNLNILIKYFINDKYKKVIKMHEHQIIKLILNFINKNINYQHMIYLLNIIFGYDERIIHNCINYYEKKEKIQKNVFKTIHKGIFCQNLQGPSESQYVRRRYQPFSDDENYYFSHDQNWSRLSQNRNQTYRIRRPQHFSDEDSSSETHTNDSLNRLDDNFSIMISSSSSGEAASLAQIRFSIIS